MGWVKLFIAIAIMMSGSSAWAEEEGLCVYEDSPTGLRRATCRFPSCAEGTDCKFPDIQKTTAIIEYLEPWNRMRRPCNVPIDGEDEASIPPSCRALRGACWEVRKRYRFRVAATDPAGVAEIGVHLGLEVGPDNRTFEKRLRPAHKLSFPTDTYSIEDEIRICVPMGGRLDIAVLEICAKDGKKNEACVFPAGMHAFHR